MIVVCRLNVYWKGYDNDNVKYSHDYDYNGQGLPVKHTLMLQWYKMIDQEH